MMHSHILSPLQANVWPFIVHTVCVYIYIHTLTQTIQEDKQTHTKEE